MHRQGSWSASAAGTTPVYSYWNAYFGGVGSQPAICSGIVILGSLNQNIYAFNATTGASVWTFPAGAMASYSAPACSVDEQVVFSTTTNNVLFAIQVSTGRALWNVSVPSSTYVAPLVVGDLVYLYVLALNANTGAVVWSHAEASGSSGQGLAVVDGVAYYGSGGGVVRSLNALSGAVGWSYNIGSSGDMSTPSVANGLVFIGSQDNSIYAIDASTGSLAWSHATGGWVLSTPAVVNGVVYFGSNDNYIYALEATSGQLVWRVDTQAAVMYGVVVANNILYGGSSHFTAMDLNNGNVLWSFVSGGCGGGCTANGSGERLVVLPD